MISTLHSKAIKIFLSLILMCSSCKTFCTKQESDPQDIKKEKLLLPEHKAEKFLVRLTPIALACAVGMVTGRISSLLEQKKLFFVPATWYLSYKIRTAVLLMVLTGVIRS